MSDLISRQAAIDRAVSIPMFGRDVKMVAVGEIKNLPSAQPEHFADVGNMDDGELDFVQKHEKIPVELRVSAQPKPCEDVVSRQTLQKELALYPIDDVTSEDEAGYNRAINDVQKMVLHLPSAQPGQHTCVNCGRIVNNGGWYADGRTRCPIEEHYALPKDGYCHLWEKRNVTDDDYPERRTDEA